MEEEWLAREKRVCAEGRWVTEGRGWEQRGGGGCRGEGWEQRGGVG